MDPLKRDIQIFVLENPLNSDDDIKIRPELEHCKSENHNFWLSKLLRVGNSIFFKLVRRIEVFFSRKFRILLKLVKILNI